ncbi:MAG TPA: hypothetical protein VJ830_03820 [Anaerolineales bacterium]|nr:hypothetical protein [Anaerolineales bacterium]
MNTHNKKSVRFIVVSLLLLVTVLTAIAPVTTAQAKAKTDRQVFHDAMRKLWEDHITWTRLVIIGVFEDLPDLDPTVQRLLQNQVEIGDAIKPFYGEEAGEQLTALLTDHILIAAEILQAAKAGDSAAQEDAIDRWYANADDIAKFLNAANPKNWPHREMRAMMREHLDLTLEEAVAYLNGDYEASIAAYDMIHLQALEMADMLSEGIIKQFPNKFKGGGGD